MHLDEDPTAFAPGATRERSLELTAHYEHPRMVTTVGRCLPDDGEVRGTRAGERRQHRGKKSAPKIRATILIADDEEMVLRVMRRLLERQGMRVLTAIDGENALQVFEENRDEIDAVILDIVMPKLDGIATLKELRTLDPAVKILLASGYSERKPDGEPVSFLQKPCRADDLAHKIDEMLGDRPSGNRLPN